MEIVECAVFRCRLSKLSCAQRFLRSRYKKLTDGCGDCPIGLAMAKGIISGEVKMVRSDSLYLDYDGVRREHSD